MKKKILFLFIQVIVLITAFTSVTYAAFTEQYHPRISPFTFNVKTQEYMMISKSGEAGTFKDEIAFNELIVEENTTFSLKPLYGSLNGEDIVIKNSSEIVENKNYIRVPVYFTASNDMNLYLLGSATTETVIQVVPQEPIIFTEEVNKYLDALRIGFVAYSINETVIGDSTSITYLPFMTNIYSKNPKDNSSYVSGLKKYETFYNTYSLGVKEDTVLLNVKANKISKMDIVIWLEADDKSIYDDEGYLDKVFNVQFNIDLRFQAVNVEESGE